MRLSPALCALVLLIALSIVPAPAHGSARLDGICPYTIGLSAGGYPMAIPYCRNYPLESGNAAITRAVIVIHGMGRTADSYYNTVANAALQAGAETRTIILAPQFLIEQDIVDYSLGNQVLFWSEGGWKQGDLSLSTSQHPRPAWISSFSVVDTIMEMLSDRAQFPNLKQIVVAGHSAGGQFVNRFAAGNRMHTALAQQYGIRFRYIVANPSSYLYFDGERRVAGTLDRFAIPDYGGCSYYNQYKYGLEYLNNYMSTTGAEQIRAQYPTREVAYLLGSQDTDPNASDLDKGCAAMFQGVHRLERGTIYYNYVLHYFGPDVAGKHTKAIVPGVGHSAYGMFNSACGLRYLFDYDPNGACGLPVRPDLSLSNKRANLVRVVPGQVVSFTLTPDNSAGRDATSISVTDTLPGSLVYQPGSLSADAGRFGEAAGVITWTGPLSAWTAVAVRYTATVSPGLSISETVALRNSMWIDDGGGTPLERAAVLFINPYETYLPLIKKP
jgi:uncharacterized repeat protein (TIGR01451 family)